MPESSLLSAGQQLHDAIDDFNASGEAMRACVLCGAAYYGSNGIEHDAICPITEWRDAAEKVRHHVQ